MTANDAINIKCKSREVCNFWGAANKPILFR